MTLLTTILNENISCTAGDTRITEHDCTHREGQKVFLLKDAIISLYEVIEEPIQEYLSKSGSEIYAKDLYSEFNKLAQAKHNNDFTGMFVISANNAHLYFYPWGVEYDLHCIEDPVIPPDIRFIDTFNYPYKFFNKPVILNPYMSTNGFSKINRRKYNTYMELFNKALLDITRSSDYNSITQNNYIKILKKFYGEAFQREDLHGGTVGGEIYIALINEKGNQLSKNIKIEY